MNVTTSNTNSSGTYYTLQSNQNIQCDDSIFCGFYGDLVSDIRITANTATVKFECVECNSPIIYAQNAENVIMKYNNSKYGQFHFENAINIDIVVSDCNDFIIYGQNAENVIVWSNNIWLTTFYLDYVSNEINFVYFYGEYTTIMAEYATCLNISFPSFGYLDSNTIYCPFQNDNVCNFMYNFKNYKPWPYHLNLNIYISNIELGVKPIYFNINATQYSDINIFCNKNENGIYQSFTEIDNNNNRLKCNNITSECCTFTDYRTDIICQDNDNAVCIIDCASNSSLNCVDSNIYPTNTTNELYVICNKCSDTIINCPTTLNSLCYVSCDIHPFSCHNTIIKYNTNNRDITLNCTKKNSCRYLQIFVDKIDNIYNNNINAPMIGVNILCGYDNCYRSTFIINAEMNYFNVDCIADESCFLLLVHAETTKNVTINCMGHESCQYSDIYAKSDYNTSLILNCPGNAACDELEVMIPCPLYYQLDFLSIFNQCSKIRINDLCNEYNGYHYHLKKISTNSSNQCTCFKDTFSYCPFSTVYNIIYHCDDDDDCYINLNDNIQGTLIYANNANLLSLSCTNCGYVNIFAMNASNVEIKCKKDCHDIHLNGVYVKKFYFECDINKDQYNFDYDGSNSWPDGCENLVFDVSFSENVFIKANYMMGSQIYALNASNLSFICTNDCSYLHLMIPSETYIECGNDRGCRNIYFYSYNEWKSIKNVNIFTCDDFILNGSNHEWYLYSPSSVYGNTEWQYVRSDDKCSWIARLQQTFCLYDYLNIDNFIHGNVTNIPILINFIFDPFSIKCRPIINESFFEIYQIIFGIIFCIISFCIIIFWFIYGIKQIYLKYFNFIKYYQMTQIEPPSQTLLLYIHCCDILIWCTQIYIVMVIWAFYEYSQYNICQNAIQNHDNDEQVCLSYSVCSFQDENCISKSMIFDLFIIISVILGFSAFMDIFRACSPRFCQLVGVETTFIRVSHSILIRFAYADNWDNIIQQFYWKRLFFRFSFECECCDHCFWDILTMITRYFLFFIITLIYYFLFNDINFHLKWYDIFPILCVLIINEFIKIRYKSFTPYDKSKHIQFCINQIYPKQIGLIIWEFMNDDKMINYKSEMLPHPKSAPLYENSSNSLPDNAEMVELIETTENYQDHQH